MTTLSQKRKFCLDIKSTLVEDLHELSLASLDLDSKVEAAKEDLKCYFKAMVERQSELYAHSTNINERYEEIISLLKGSRILNVAESSRRLTRLPLSYQNDTKRFLDDTVVSLDNYTTTNIENVHEIIADVNVFSNEFAAKMVDLKREAEQLVEQRTRVSGLLTNFKENM